MAAMRDDGINQRMSESHEVSILPAHGNGALKAGCIVSSGDIRVTAQYARRFDSMEVAVRDECSAKPKDSLLHKLPNIIKGQLALHLPVVLQVERGQVLRQGLQCFAR